MSVPKSPDIGVTNQGTTWLFFGITEKGRAWLTTNLPAKPDGPGWSLTPAKGHKLLGRILPAGLRVRSVL